MRKANLRELLMKRQQLRINSTEAENLLWEHLKNKQLGGRKFRRQHSIGCFIIDFYCPTEMLCVELDGQHHFTTNGEFRDLEKTGFLESFGIKVIRFENRLVSEELDFVLKSIQENFKKQILPAIIESTYHYLCG